MNMLTFLTDTVGVSWNDNRVKNLGTPLVKFNTNTRLCRHTQTQYEQWNAYLG